MLREAAGKSGRGCDSNVNFGISEGNSHSLHMTVFVSMRDSSEAWMRTRDWLT